MHILLYWLCVCGFRLSVHKTGGGAILGRSGMSLNVVNLQ